MKPLMKLLVEVLEARVAVGASGRVDDAAHSADIVEIEPSVATKNSYTARVTPCSKLVRPSCSIAENLRLRTGRGLRVVCNFPCICGAGSVLPARERPSID